MSIKPSASPRSTASRYCSMVSSTDLFACENGMRVPATYVTFAAQPADAITTNNKNLIMGRRWPIAESAPARETLHCGRKLAKSRAAPRFAPRQKGTEVLLGVVDPCQIDIGDARQRE